MAAADVEAVHAHAGRLAENAAQTSVAVGTPTSLSVVKSVPTFDDCMSTTGDAPVTVTFLQRGNLHLAVDGQNLAERQDDACPLEGLEPGQLERQLYVPGRERGETILAVAFGHSGPDAHQRWRLRGDGHTGQHGSLRIGHGSRQPALSICAIAGAAAAHIAANNINNLRRLIKPP